MRSKETKVKFDLHTHHDRCGHARGKIQDYIESAIDKGLDVIGIADHTPFFSYEEDQAFPKIAMPKSEFPEYVKEVLRLKGEYSGKIEVLLGIEADFFPEHVELYRPYFERFPFDYIIGSVHQVDGVSIFNKRRWKGMAEKKKVMTKDIYYQLIEDSARSGMYQILGHIDAMKGFYPEFSDIQTKSVEKTLKVIGENDIAIEINTSGKTKTVGGWYPSDDILELANHYGVAVTFGSDAHDPERVGDEFDSVAKRLKEIGFKEWCYFKNKKRIIAPL
ncbi:histidinol-phosphatase [Bacillus sp. B15-48]|uniref:histidinol-phosphatase n=1 Tax=Bacillus sp. B15-48 TaxID=1548601 RepID=UPI00193FE110|nr:histidinol-phosphatase [Bacillus sp. B15-48]MBM4762833.1 histidinol-phosphatase HisJ family protein [Bacillus sp. B15-48]